MMKGRKILGIGTGVLAAGIVMLVLCYGVVSRNATGRIFDRVEDVPAMEYGVLLATSPVTQQGGHNYYFDNRIAAADELYKAGKIRKIIASGGDYRESHKYGCDEPAAIRDSLVARGVPEDVILLDYDGQRTIKSIVNAKDVYGLDCATLISQKYHNERAIYLADHYGLNAVGYNALTPQIIDKKIRNIGRELLARVKMFMDLWC